MQTIEPHINPADVSWPAVQDLWCAWFRRVLADAVTDTPEGATARVLLRDAEALALPCAVLNLDVGWVQREAQRLFAGQPSTCLPRGYGSRSVRARLRELLPQREEWTLAALAAILGETTPAQRQRLVAYMSEAKRDGRVQSVGRGRYVVVRTKREV